MSWEFGKVICYGGNLIPGCSAWREFFLTEDDFFSPDIR
jgi:hypothetical protein